MSERERERVREKFVGDFDTDAYSCPPPHVLPSLLADFYRAHRHE